MEWLWLCRVGMYQTLRQNIPQGLALSLDHANHSMHIHQGPSPRAGEIIRIASDRAGWRDDYPSVSCFYVVGVGGRDHLRTVVHIDVRWSLGNPLAPPWRVTINPVQRGPAATPPPPHPQNNEAQKLNENLTRKKVFANLKLNGVRRWGVKGEEAYPSVVTRRERKTNAGRRKNSHRSQRLSGFFSPNHRGAGKSTCTCT